MMDAKKKKNKKKKGSQQKVTEDATSNSEKVVLQESNNGFGLEENYSAHTSTIVDIPSVGVSESDTEHDKHKIYEEKFAKLQGEVGQLEYERTLWLQKQVNLEEKIKVLQDEVDLCARKEAVLEEKLHLFQTEKDKLIQKEAILEDMLKNVENIKDNLILIEENVDIFRAPSETRRLEKINEAISLKERIAGVEEASIALDMQVKELEGSRNTFFEENKCLMEKVTGLELRIQSLEERATSCENSTEKTTKLPEDIISVQQIEAASALFGDQTFESTELSRKVNEPYIAPEKHGGHYSGTEPNHVEMLDRASSPSHYESELGDKKTESGEIAQSMEFQEKLGTNGASHLVSETVAQSGPPPPWDEPRISEVGTVPFDEILIHEDDVMTTKNNDISEAVPFSDAPLIGAPFRLISFVAKYVSGADLVNQNSSRSGR